MVDWNESYDALHPPYGLAENWNRNEAYDDH